MPPAAVSVNGVSASTSVAAGHGAGRADRSTTNTTATADDHPMHAMVRVVPRHCRDGAAMKI
jgi:hypothetical protein